MGTKTRGNWYLNEKLLFMIAISLSIQSAVTLCGSQMNITNYYPLEVFGNYKQKNRSGSSGAKKQILGA